MNMGQDLGFFSVVWGILILACRLSNKLPSDSVCKAVVKNDSYEGNIAKCLQNELRFRVNKTKRFQVIRRFSSRATDNHVNNTLT